jgi:hypothetical protein
MPEMQDYLRLASEADDSAVVATAMPDPELAASYRALADSYHRLARFRNGLSAYLIVGGHERDS